LEMLHGWSGDGTIDLERPETLDSLLTPVLMSHPWVASLAVADDSGREYRIYRLEDGLRSRFLDRGAVGDQTRERLWRPASGDGERSVGATDYDPRTRPWFVGAQTLLEGHASSSSLSADDLFWTDPYTFFESGDPGISVAAASSGAAGGVVVLTADLRLADISRFTSSIEIGVGGKTFVLSEDGRLIGLPRSAPDAVGWFMLVIRGGSDLVVVM